MTDETIEEGRALQAATKRPWSLGSTEHATFSHWLKDHADALLTAAAQNNCGKSGHSYMFLEGLSTVCEHCGATDQ